MKTKSIALGALFGFLLVRTGASEAGNIFGMFRLTDLHLVGVIGAAIVVAGLGLYLFERYRVRTVAGEPLAITRKPMAKGLVTGGLMFGAGWALAGACPGTTLAMIGQGKLAGLAVFAGILGGAWVQQRVAARKPQPAPVPMQASAPGSTSAHAA